MTRKRHTEEQSIAVLKDAGRRNRRLKQMVAEQALDIQALKAINAKTGRVQGEASGGSVEH